VSDFAAVLTIASFRRNRGGSCELWQMMESKTLKIYSIKREHMNFI
jgi:hypothetical protein